MLNTHRDLYLNSMYLLETKGKKGSFNRSGEDKFCGINFVYLSPNRDLCVFNTLACLTLLFYSNLFPHVLIFEIIITLIYLLS